jgi:arsenate reductase
MYESLDYQSLLLSLIYVLFLNSIYTNIKKNNKMIQIYHNPRCGKSRNCVAFVETAGKEYEIIKYLENSPSTEEIASLLKKLDCKPMELVRQKEKIWTEKFKNIKMTDEAIIEVLTTYPILIERPILIKEDKAIIGRDLDRVAHFI